MLTNARCLTEGVDVPTLDGVAFIDPRRSQVDIVQAVGRAMRKADDKTVGTIVIPVFVDENADPEEALDSSEFDRVWQVVKALRAHDEVLAEELDELRRERGRRKTSGGRPGKIVLDLPVGVGVAFARAFDTKVVETSTASWEFWWGLLNRFVDRETSRPCSDRHVEDGYPLGAWANSQRKQFLTDRLTPDGSPRWRRSPAGPGAFRTPCGRKGSRRLRASSPERAMPSSRTATWRTASRSELGSRCSGASSVKAAVALRQSGLLVSKPSRVGHGTRRMLPGRRGSLPLSGSLPVRATPAFQRTTKKTATRLDRGSPCNASATRPSGFPRSELRSWRRFPAGSGIRSVPSGRRASRQRSSMPCAKDTAASRKVTLKTATRSAPGSAINAAPTAPVALRLSEPPDWSRSLAGHGT